MTQLCDPQLTLTGRLVELRPLSGAYAGALAEAAADGTLWELWYTSVPRPEDMAADIEAKLAMRDTGTMVPFITVRRAVGDIPEQVLGVTTFYDIRAALPALEIGYTWNRASAHGTGTNAESKLLLMTHAFEVLGCRRVAFHTNWLNHQSRAAIARLGAVQEGVLRQENLDREGRPRDSVVFSVLAHEWPGVRRGLEHRLHRH